MQTFERRTAPVVGEVAAVVAAATDDMSARSQAAAATTVEFPIIGLASPFLKASGWVARHEKYRKKNTK